MRLEAGRVLLPLGMAEVRMRGAGGDDEVVVGEASCRRRALRASAATSMDDRLAEDHVDVASACAGSARIGAAMSLGFRRRRRDLVEQRLEEVVVVPVDEGDVRGATCLRPRAVYRPAKPPPMMTIRGMRARSLSDRRWRSDGREARGELAHDAAHVVDSDGSARNLSLIWWRNSRSSTSSIPGRWRRDKVGITTIERHEHLHAREIRGQASIGPARSGIQDFHRHFDHGGVRREGQTALLSQGTHPRCDGGR